MRVTIIGKGHGIETQGARHGRRHGLGHGRAGNLRIRLEYIGRAVCGAGCPHHFAVNLAEHAEARPGIEGVEHQGGQIAAAHRVNRHCAGAEPQHNRDAAKGQDRDHQHHPGAHHVSLQGGAECLLDSMGEPPAARIALAIGLDQFDRVESFCRFCARFGQS